MALGALTTRADPASVADRFQTFFSKRLLDVQVDLTVMDQFAMLEDLPKNSGGDTIRFFKPEKASSVLKTATTDTTNYSVQALTEGTAISNFRQNILTKVDVTLKQFGEATRISDILQMTDAYKPLKQNIELMGRDAALHYDTVLRNCLVGSTHPSGSGTPLTHGSNASIELFATATANTFTFGGTSATLFTALSGATASNAVATRKAILAAVTRLRNKQAPTLRGGNYVCVIPPAIEFDLVQDSAYANAFQSAKATGIYKYELGTIDGCTFVRSTNPFIEDETYGTYDSTDNDADGLIYSTIFLGANAYGAPKIAGSNSPKRPQVIITDTSDSANPLNQYITAGWKAFYMGIGLDSDNICVLRTKTNYSGT